MSGGTDAVASNGEWEVADLKLGLIRMTPERARFMRRFPTLVVSVILLAVVVWVIFLANRSWTWETTASSAISEPGEFLTTFLNGLTFAGLLFVVASGFTLIFGLMRTVNMAHGAFFLLGAYLAIEIQQKMVDKTRNIDPVDVSLAEWIVPMLIAATVVAVVGLVVQQLLLRWNQGQDLRQAIITIAVAVILGDQMLKEFGGVNQKMVWPGDVVHYFDGDLPSLLGERYPTSRLFMLGLAVLVGAILWLWLNRTRMGMVIRAGVDDQDMVRALGIKIGVLFAVTFFVGAFLAGMGGVMGASLGVDPGTGGEWLLHSLVVVIIGGLGSVKGAVAGSIVYGMVIAFAPAYLPATYSFYSIVLTFVILAIVLAVKPNGLFGKAE